MGWTEPKQRQLLQKKRSGSKSKASLRRVRAVEYILHKLLMASVSSSAAAANLVFSKHTRQIVRWKKTKKKLAEKKKNGMVSRSTTNWFIRISVIVDYTLHGCICQHLQTAFSNQEYVLPAKKTYSCTPLLESSWSTQGLFEKLFRLTQKNVFMYTLTGIILVHTGTAFNMWDPDKHHGKELTACRDGTAKNWYTKHSSTQYPLPILESY